MNELGSLSKASNSYMTRVKLPKDIPLDYWTNNSPLITEPTTEHFCSITNVQIVCNSR
jgi:hypothetical protein